MKHITHSLKERKKLARSKIRGSKLRPRVSVSVSNKYTYAQLIDDEARRTLVSFSSLKLKKDKNYKAGKKVEQAREVGVELAKISQKNGIKQATLDRGKYPYKGRVKSLTEGLREGGLKI